MDHQELAEEAKRIYETGDYLSAAQMFKQAADLFDTAGDPLMAAEIKNNLCVALLRAGQPLAALEAVEGTQEVFTRANDQRRAGMAYANRASVHEALKRFQDAITDYEKAGEALEKAGEEQMRVQVMQLLSALHLRRWKFLNAVVALQSGLAGVRNPTPKQRLMKKLLFIRL